MGCRLEEKIRVAGWKGRAELGKRLPGTGERESDEGESHLVKIKDGFGMGCTEVSYRL